MAIHDPFRILTVDNEPSVLCSLKFVFSAPRFEVTSAESGAAALACLAPGTAPYDVIIVDQKMPSLTGAELVAEMRKRGVAGKVIVLSAHVSPAVRETYDELQVHAILTKPFDLTELRSAVEAVVA